MKFVNLTNHEIYLIGPHTMTVPVSGTTARVEEETRHEGWTTIGAVQVPLISKRYGRIEGLPPRNAGTIYITSTLVAIAAWEEGRDDVVAPGELARDGSGRPVGCMNFAVRGNNN